MRTLLSSLLFLLATPALAGAPVIWGSDGAAFLTERVHATTFVGALEGVATSCTQFSATPSACASNKYSNGIAANGNLTCSYVNFNQLTGDSETLGTATSTDGSVVLANANTAGLLTIKGTAVSSYNFNLPTSAGTSGYVLASGGGGATAMSWLNIGGTYAPLASPTFTGTSTTPALNVSGQTASRACYLDASKNLTSSATTNTELGYLSGVTSAVQTQINSKYTTGTAIQFIDGLGAIYQLKGPTDQDFQITNSTGKDTIISDVETGLSSIRVSHANGGVSLNGPKLSLQANQPIIMNGDTSLSRTSANNVAFGNGVQGDATGTVAAAGFTVGGATASRACYLDSSKNLSSSATTDTELGYLSGVTSAVQTQITARTKADGTVPFTGDQSMGSHKLTNVTDPGSAQDAATKNYVDTHSGTGTVGSFTDNSGLFSVANPTTAPTTTYANQSANTALHGPSSGSAAPPTFRANVPADMAVSPTAYFGYGGDGDVTCSGASTLARDMWYHNLTLNAGCAINTSHFRIFVSGTLDATACPAGAIVNDGVDGSTATATQTGAAGGAASTNSTNSSFMEGGIGSGTTGGNGGSSANGSGSSNAGTWNNTTDQAFGGPGGRGGTGGNSSNTGGSGGTVQAAYTAKIIGLPLILFRKSGFFINSNSAQDIADAAPGSGGGGGAGNVGVGGGGGGGGGPGGGVFVSAAIVSRGGSTTARCISVRGGTGGNGSVGVSGTNQGGGGGAGGGGGGLLVFYYGQLSGSTATNMLDVSGGGGGSGGNGLGTGLGGDGGGPGSSGQIFACNLGQGGSCTQSAFATGTANTHSASTGGGAAARTTSQLSI